MGELPRENIQGSRQVWGSGNHPGWFPLFKWCIYPPKRAYQYRIRNRQCFQSTHTPNTGCFCKEKKIPQAIKSITLKFFILSCLHAGDLILWVCVEAEWFQNVCMTVYLYANVILRSVTSLGRPLEVHWNVFIKNPTVSNLGCREEPPGERLNLLQSDHTCADGVNWCFVLGGT